MTQPQPSHDANAGAISPAPAPADHANQADASGAAARLRSDAGLPPVDNSQQTEATGAAARLRSDAGLPPVEKTQEGAGKAPAADDKLRQATPGLDTVPTNAHEVNTNARAIDNLGGQGPVRVREASYSTADGKTLSGNIYPKGNNEVFMSKEGQKYNVSKGTDGDTVLKPQGGAAALSVRDSSSINRNGTTPGGSSNDRVIAPVSQNVAGAAAERAAQQHGQQQALAQAQQRAERNSEHQPTPTTAAERSINPSVAAPASQRPAEGRVERPEAKPPATQPEHNAHAEPAERNVRIDRTDRVDRQNRQTNDEQDGFKGARVEQQRVHQEVKNQDRTDPGKVERPESPARPDSHLDTRAESRPKNQTGTPDDGAGENHIGGGRMRSAEPAEHNQNISANAQNAANRNQDRSLDRSAERQTEHATAKANDKPAETAPTASQRQNTPQNLASQPGSSGRPDHQERGDHQDHDDARQDNRLQGRIDNHVDAHAADAHPADAHAADPHAPDTHAAEAHQAQNHASEVHAPDVRTNEPRPVEHQAERKAEPEDLNRNQRTELLPAQQSKMVDARNVTLMGKDITGTNGAGDLHAVSAKAADVHADLNTHPVETHATETHATEAHATETHVTEAHAVDVHADLHSAENQVKTTVVNPLNALNPLIPLNQKALAADLNAAKIAAIGLGLVGDKSSAGAKVEQNLSPLKPGASNALELPTGKNDAGGLVKVESAAMIAQSLMKMDPRVKPGLIDKSDGGKPGVDDAPPPSRTTGDTGVSANIHDSQSLHDRENVRAAAAVNAVDTALDDQTKVKGEAEEGSGLNLKQGKPVDGMQLLELEEKAKRKAEEQSLEEDASKARNAMMAALLNQKTKQDAIDKEEQLAIDSKKKGEDKRRRYVVKDKDTLETIAKKQLRDIRLAALIYEINKHMLPLRMEKGKQVAEPRSGTSIWLPSDADISGFRGRLYSTGAGVAGAAAKGSGSASDQSPDDELAEKFGANWDGNKASSAVSAGLMGAAVAKSQVRQSNIEKVLGPLASPKVPEGGRIRYIVRLSDTIDGVAVKHPALKDVDLWPLLARLNDLSEELDGRGRPVAELKRGMVLDIPTPYEIESFRADEFELYVEPEAYEAIASAPASHETSSEKTVIVNTESDAPIVKVAVPEVLPEALPAYQAELAQTQPSQAITSPYDATTMALPSYPGLPTGRPPASVTSNLPALPAVNALQAFAYPAGQETVVLPQASVQPPTGSNASITSPLPVTPSPSQAVTRPLPPPAWVNNPPESLDQGPTQILPPQYVQPQAQPLPPPAPPQFVQPQAQAVPPSAPPPPPPTTFESPLTPAIKPFNRATPADIMRRAPIVAGDRFMWELERGVRLVKSAVRWDPAVGVLRAQLEVLHGDTWYPVIFYEVFPEGAIRHEYLTGGKRKSVKMDLPPSAVQELADNDLINNWGDYCRRFVQQLAGPR